MKRYPKTTIRYVTFIGILIYSLYYDCNEMEKMKTPRTYNSPARAKQAEATKAAILKAAAELFTRDGYTSTSLAAVARTAGVALNTIYSSIGGKPALILALAQGGVDDDSAKATVDKVMASRDAAEILQLTAMGICEVRRLREAAINVLLDNRLSDPDVAAAEAVARCVVRRRLTAIAEHLVAVGGLRPGLSVDRVAEIMAYYFGFESSRTLRSFGWSWRDIQEWLSTEAGNSLLSE
ncbi:TetR/AcrR family transcriptional regulator [Rhizobium leguminosarum]|uniref:TetR/AcrR family transcriptional regulator n=1 Tax=Rhizobium leguminosarum TaxID=384 RepID=UPI003F99A12C